jgi:hypothetical protein
MRLYLYILSLLTLPVFAEISHLDIRNPSLVAASLNGPIKKISEEYNYATSDRKYREIAAYDKAGNLTYRRKQNHKDEITFFMTNTYNEAGCQVRQIVDDKKNNEKFDYEIILSPETRQVAYKCRLTGEIEIVTYNADKYRMNATVKKKAKKRVPLSKYKRGPDNRTKSYTRYDDNGRVKYITVSERDEEGRLMRAVTTYKREKRNTTNQYEYLEDDELGNWTQRLLKMVVVKDGEEKIYEKFTMRMIEYYDSDPTTVANEAL